MTLSSTVTKIAIPDEFPTDSDVWERMWRMGDPGALELVETEFWIEDLDS